MKTITFDYDGNSYRLTYTLKSIKTMEDTGFDVRQLQSKPATMTPKLFEGSFIANHTGIKRKLVNEIWEQFGNDKQVIIETLLDIYVDTLNLITQGESEETKKISWGTEE